MDVPVVDIGGFAGGSAAERGRIAAAVDRAACEVGFMQVVGHAIPDDAVAGLGAAIDGFFALPAAAKERWRRRRPISIAATAAAAASG